MSKADDEWRERQAWLADLEREANEALGRYLQQRGHDSDEHIPNAPGMRDVGQARAEEAAHDQTDEEGK